MKTEIITIIQRLNQRPRTYYPMYIDATNSLTAGVLLSQIMYYFSVSNDNEIILTDKRLMEDCRVSKNEMASAKKKIRKMPFLTIEIKGIPPKTKYIIDWKKYVEYFETQFPEIQDFNFLKSRITLYGNSGNSDTEIQENIYKENNKRYIKKEKENILKEKEFRKPSYSEWKKELTKKFKEKVPSLSDEEINIEVEYSYNFYEERDWKVNYGGKLKKMKSWKLACSNWVLNYLRYKRKNKKNTGREPLRQVDESEYDFMDKIW